MIPDFKTYIGESTWGEMRKRSSGETIRKEDEFNDLCEFIKNNYFVLFFIQINK